MSNDSIAAQIGQAWRYQREGKTDAAIAEFDRILRQDTDNVDAHYGMGLAQRAAGKYETAIKHFERALALVEAGAAARYHGHVDEILVANTPEDDRLMMLNRMIKQRLAETNNAMKPRV
jgi:tetratricopeptide (TPR) repeat protein